MGIFRFHVLRSVVRRLLDIRSLFYILRYHRHSNFIQNHFAIPSHFRINDCIQ